MVKLSSVNSKYFVLFVFAIVLFYIPTGRSLIIITHRLLKTSRATPMYSSSCNNLSGVMKGLQSDYYMHSFDAELKASTCIQMRVGCRITKHDLTQQDILIVDM